MAMSLSHTHTHTQMFAAQTQTANTHRSANPARNTHTRANATLSDQYCITAVCSSARGYSDRWGLWVKRFSFPLHVGQEHGADLRRPRSSGSCCCSSLSSEGSLSSLWSLMECVFFYLFIFFIHIAGTSFKVSPTTITLLIRIVCIRIKVSVKVIAPP